MCETGRTRERYLQGPYPDRRFLAIRAAGPFPVRKLALQGGFRIEGHRSSPGLVQTNACFPAGFRERLLDAQNASRVGWQLLRALRHAIGLGIAARAVEAPVVLNHLQPHQPGSVGAGDTRNATSASPLARSRSRLVMSTSSRTPGCTCFSRIVRCVGSKFDGTSLLSNPRSAV